MTKKKNLHTLFKKNIYKIHGVPILTIDNEDQMIPNQVRTI